MPLGTLDAPPPPFFRQGPSALSKLALFSAFAIFLMAADVRLKITQPVRAVLATAIYPVQWTAMRPMYWLQSGSKYFQTLRTSQANERAAYKKVEVLAQKAGQVDSLQLENTRLRALLALRERVTVGSQAAQVLYDAADPYTRKVIIDRGVLDHVIAGSPVLDETGVLGQVTRVYPSVSEVTLVTDHDQAIPVLNTRTGARGVAFGDPASRSDAQELRYMAANADVQVGDLLTTSGVDGVYPPGLPVARVHKIERRVDSAFARIVCFPLAKVAGAEHVLVLKAVTDEILPRPEEPVTLPSAARGRGRR